MGKNNLQIIYKGLGPRIYLKRGEGEKIMRRKEKKGREEGRVIEWWRRKERRGRGWGSGRR